MKTIAGLLLLAFAVGGSAQPLPPPDGPPPGRHGPGAPSPEMLATVPNLTPAQQAQLRALLIERRDAHETAAEKTRSEHEALMKRDRAEHERIDTQYAERLRKLLGDDGYRAFAQWQLAHRPGRGPQEHGPDGRGPPRRTRFDHGDAAPPTGPERDNGGP